MLICLNISNTVINYNIDELGYHYTVALIHLKQKGSIKWWLQFQCLTESTMDIVAQGSISPLHIGSHHGSCSLQQFKVWFVMPDMLEQAEILQPRHSSIFSYVNGIHMLLCGVSQIDQSSHLRSCKEDRLCHLQSGQESVIFEWYYGPLKCPSHEYLAVNLENYLM